MATTNSTQTAGNNTQDQGVRPKMRTMYDKLTTMFELAQDRMSLEELDSLANLEDEAISRARNLSTLCSGLGSLVSDDANRPDGKNGAFQDGDEVFSLLWMLSDELDTIAAMSEVGSCASWKAQQVRERDRSGFAESSQ